MPQAACAPRSRELNITTRTLDRRAEALQLDRARVHFGSKSVRYSLRALERLDWYRKLHGG